ncbi:rCG35332, isoform CRA_a [Rattus norvegicus]|uniref:RCG35332, isoform CRA_a n=1 Tax=Rattus norvegicus TaxID=10116 RepID=A6HEF3_RAT|nr:rCG35332, isoform CRA_a [Rattus norvegicus]
MLTDGASVLKSHLPPGPPRLTTHSLHIPSQCGLGPPREVTESLEAVGLGRLRNIC